MKYSSFKSFFLWWPSLWGLCDFCGVTPLEVLFVLFFHLHPVWM